MKVIFIYYYEWIFILIIVIHIYEYNFRTVFYPKYRSVCQGIWDLSIFAQSCLSPIYFQYTILPEAFPDSFPEQKDMLLRHPPPAFRAAQNFCNSSNPTLAIISVYTFFSLDYKFLKDRSCEFFSSALIIVGFENWSHADTQTEKTTISPNLLFSGFFPTSMGKVLQSILQTKQIEESQITLGYTLKYTCYKCVCKCAFSWQVSQKRKSDSTLKTPITIRYCWGWNCPEYSQVV